jgi:pimeloyl-ACP methyl ester carboxylesterase
MKLFSGPQPACGVSEFCLRYHLLPGSAGGGPPLVLLHGLGASSSCDYALLAAAPPLAGRPCVLLDLPGFGFSDRPEAFAYTSRSWLTSSSVIGTAALRLGSSGIPSRSVLVLRVPRDKP